MKNEQPPFCFLHIPKTGGVTFHNVLIDMFPGKKRISFVSREEAYRFFALPPEQKFDYKLVKGHFWFDADKFSPAPGSVFFTFLREPIARSISHYFFLYQNPKHWFYDEMKQHQYTMKQMLETGKVLNLDNCMVRFLSGNVMNGWDRMDEKDLQTAIQNFDKYFTHFGINEYYDESLLILAEQMGWKMPCYARLNEGTKKKKEPFDDETQKLLVHFNRLDEKLYQHGLAKFKLLLKEREQMLQRKLPLYKEANKKYWSWRVKLYPYLGSRMFR